ncbi:restriction endonuclease [Sphingomonas sp. CGMCC 1.13654]|uniref:Restriction endonuclease n=2 Tax=Sphingomonas chungangi TaxID=2683589 RepID=A0A838LGT7_9SPHN|nr:restriction endonuclease [Sphingomonas chungangi]MBA2936638.1 restriction endonuclease [Sphingomonas chungangi]
MWPTLVALKATGGSASNEELLAKIIELDAIPDEVASIVHTDGRQTKLAYNLAWAKTYLKKDGVLDNSQRGVWSLTEKGEGITREQVRLIPAAVRKADFERRRDVEGAPTTGAGEQDDSESEVASWRDRLLLVLKSMEPAAFERLSQRILREAGFVKVEVTGRSGDGGIDGVGVLRLNLLSFITLFQCKRYVGTVGPGTVRDFRGAMVGRSDKGLIITTGTFSTDARREATRDGAPAIDLIDGDQLCTLLKDLKLGLKTEIVERVTVDDGWFAQL